MFCHNCGTEFEGNFCPKCGQKSIIPKPLNENTKEASLNPNGFQVTEYNNPSSIKVKKSKWRIFWGIVIAIGVVMWVLYLAGFGSDEIEKNDDNSKNYVEMVKQGYPLNYPDKKYGESFENFFSNPSWEYFVGTKEGPDEDGDGVSDYSEEGLDIVEFTGGCIYQDVEVKALIQFTLSKDSDTFEATYLSFNKVPQSNYMLLSLMDAVFTDENLDNIVGNEDSTPDEDSISNEEYQYLDQFIAYYKDTYPDSNLSKDEYKKEYDAWENGDFYTDLYIDENGNIKNKYDGLWYDYEALSYAGYYVGQEGFEISFNAYSDTDGDEIGNAEVFYEGNQIGIDPVYWKKEFKEWFGDRYEQIYAIYYEDGDVYICFYTENGVCKMDYISDSTGNLDTLERTEVYEI